MVCYRRHLEMTGRSSFSLVYITKWMTTVVLNVLRSYLHRTKIIEVSKRRRSWSRMIHPTTCLLIVKSAQKWQVNRRQISHSQLFRLHSKQDTIVRHERSSELVHTLCLRPITKFRSMSTAAVWKEVNGSDSKRYRRRLFLRLWHP